MPRPRVTIGDGGEAGRARRACGRRSRCRDEGRRARGSNRASRWSSLACSTPPNARFAAARASSGGIPRRSKSSWRSAEMRVNLQRELTLGSSRRKARIERNHARRRAGTWRPLLFVEQQLVDESREPAPALGLLARARACPLRVIASYFASRPDSVRCHAPLDPAVLLEADERRVQRALVQRKRDGRRPARAAPPARRRAAGPSWPVPGAR